MKKKLNCVLLVDDDNDCHYFHKRLINKMIITEKLELANDGEEALTFLKSRNNGMHPKPDIIFLDLNMPGMNGWEFLEEYKKLDEELKAKILVIVTTSINLDDRKRAENIGDVNGFRKNFLQWK